MRLANYYILSLLFILSISSATIGQTILNPGDIVIISMKADNPDDFRFIPLVNLDAGTEIFFTDNGWKASTSEFRNNEGILKYTASSLITAGTNIAYDANSDFMSVSGSFSLATSGDQILAYQGSAMTPQFIYALQCNGSAWESDATNTNTSAVPTGLSDGINAVAVGEKDNIWYDCSIMSGSASDILTAVSTATNWIGDNSAYTPCTTDFTVSDMPPLGLMKILISEIVVSPTVGEYIEIYNPNNQPVDLSDFYITDATFANGSAYYYNIVTGTDAGGGSFGDFHARFPAGAMISPGEFQTIALNGSTNFNTTYNQDPTYELYEDDATADAIPDMVEAIAGSINNQGALTNSGEVAILYQWDGIADIVSDSDYVVWGDKGEGVDKTGVMTDGPDADMMDGLYLDDTAIALQDSVADTGHADSQSFHRVDYTEGQQVSSGGNGITGADESSEDLSQTWVTLSMPTPNADETITTPISTTLISAIQGTGLSVINPGATVRVEAVVTADYQEADELRGFFIQEETTDEDGDPMSSEGIFVYCNDCLTDVAEGDLVELTGLQEEFFDMSQIDISANSSEVTILSSGNIGLVTPAMVSLPAATGTDEEGTFENIEGMKTSFSTLLTVTEFFQLGRYGQMVLSSDGKLNQHTQVASPTAAGYTMHLTDVAKRKIILDDLNNAQNIDPVYHPQPSGFSTTDYIRGGYTVSDLTGIMHWSFSGSGSSNAWRIRPIQSTPVTFTPSNTRPAVPALVDSDIKVASFNVLNYFNGDGMGGGFPTSRGAHSIAEFDRQSAKIVSALLQMDADVIGLVEIENDYADGVNSSVASLVNKLNTAIGSQIYDYINPGANVGSDAITNGFIYKPAVLMPIGNTAILDDPSFTNPNNLSTPKNRAAFAQSFEVIDVANPSHLEVFTAVENHFKSKGSECGIGDDDATTGQGNCNDTRTKAAQALATWLDTDPTAIGDPDYLILGDLNAYAMENPIAALSLAGYTDLGATLDFSNSSYVFGGEWGTLDYALANEDLLDQVVDAKIWNINADEVNLLDYNDDIQDSQESSFAVKPSVNNLYVADQYRSSDHDPVMVGLSLSSCQATLTLTGTTDAPQYIAGENIISNAIVPTSSDVIYSAGTQICLETTFEVEAGAVFEVIIDGCD